MSDLPEGPVKLVMRRLVSAPPARVFAAWTEAERLKQWWGPDAVTCIHAHIDLRVGGRYRIGNRFPDGSLIWISGEFEQVTPPHDLVYTWRVEPGAGAIERVALRFEPCGGGTEILLTHERIPDALTRDRHRQGWIGCFDGLQKYLAIA